MIQTLRPVNLLFNLEFSKVLPLKSSPSAMNNYFQICQIPLKFIPTLHTTPILKLPAQPLNFFTGKSVYEILINFSVGNKCNADDLTFSLIRCSVSPAHVAKFSESSEVKKTNCVCDGGVETSIDFHLRAFWN